ncbi:hypothetical protein [Egbenema bharatensis]
MLQNELIVSKTDRKRCYYPTSPYPQNGLDRRNDLCPFYLPKPGPSG